MRLAAYAGASAALAAGTLVKAFSQRPNYYSATVYLSQSNACILILTNLALVCTIYLLYGFQRVLFGRLRPIEVEQLSEKAWYAVLDTLLAMPSLRDDVGGWLVIIFAVLLGAKVWCWIAEGRVDVLEQQPPENPTLFRLQLGLALVTSLGFNLVMVRYCLSTVLENPRPGMMLIFTFEFTILSIFSVFTLCRYFLTLWEAHIVANQTKEKREELKQRLRRAREQEAQAEGRELTSIVIPTDDDVDDNEIDVPGWEEKRRWLFGLELATDFIKIVIYTVFFTISLTFIGLPMHIMRDVYMTLVNFGKRIQSYSNYRKATQDMNTRYPDATTEELAERDECIVCRDQMTAWSGTPAAPGQPPTPLQNEGLRPKKLPCGHVLHLRCLKAWLERQQACPTCRRSVIAVGPTRNTPPQNGPNNANNANNWLGGMQGQGFNAAAAPGGNVGPPPQPPQQGGRQGQPPQARGRPVDPIRWWNMGPIRFGLYHGLGDPTHGAGLPPEQLRQLGANMTGSARSARWNRRNHGSNQDYLRAVELRLLEQAHNLEVERSQLAHVRALEGELARLRTLRVPSRSTGTSSTLPSDQAPTTAQLSDQSQGLQSNDTAPQHQAQVPRQPAAAARHMAPNQPASHPPQAGVPPVPTPRVPFSQATQRYQQASGAETLMAGDAGLPQGLVLPEGWSLTPMRRALVPGGVQFGPGPIYTQVTGGQPTPSPAPDSTQHPVQADSNPTPRQAAPTASSEAENSPRNESRLQSTANHASSTSRDADARDARSGPTEGATAAAGQSRAGHLSEPAWGFIPADSERDTTPPGSRGGLGQPASGIAEDPSGGSSGEVNGHAGSSEHGNSKKQGKAVEVEDVQDDGS